MSPVKRSGLRHRAALRPADAAGDCQKDHACEAVLRKAGTAPRPSSGSPSSSRAGDRSTPRSSGCGAQHRAVHSVPGIPAGDPQDLLYDQCESLNSRFRQACRRGHFPDENSALKVLYLVIQNPQKNRANVTGGTPGWKEAIDALTMYYGERITFN